MPVQVSLLQLEGYYVQELSFVVRPGLEDQMNLAMQGGLHVQSLQGLFNPDPITINVQAGIAPNSEDPLRWGCIIRVESRNVTEKRFPYDFVAVLVGYFKVHESVPAENIEPMVKINGASLLYSAARELIATATGRGPFPAALLPTIAFSLDEESKQQLLPTTEAVVTPKGRKTSAQKVLKRTAKKKVTSKKGTK